MSETSISTPSPFQDLTRIWWLYLVFGVLWILFGMWLWSYRVGSLVALAALIGITFMFSGVTEIVVGLRLPAYGWLAVTLGAVSIVAGFIVLIWQDRLCTSSRYFSVGSFSLSALCTSSWPSHG